MESLTLFFPLHVFPTEKHLSTILIDNLKKSLNKKIKTKYIFFIYDQDKSEKQLDENILIYFDQFSNAIEVLEKTKPDVVFLNEDRSTIDLSFHIACDFLKIPVVCPINHIWLTNYKVSKKVVFSKLKFLFSNNSSSSSHASENSFNSKLKFLINTMKRSGHNFFQVFNILLKLLISQLNTKPVIFSKSSNTLFRLESEYSVPILLKNNFSESNLVVTGNPIYDELFKRINNFKQRNNQEKLNILFAPSQVFEDRIWNKKDSDRSFIEILKILSKNKDKFSTIVKIHPTSVNISDYLSLIKKIDSGIPIFQKENFLDLLETCDVVIGYPANSTMLRYCLLAKKPIILCNFFNNNSCEILEKKLAFECKSPDKLMDLILKILKNNPSVSQEAENFFTENFYKRDGLSTERLIDSIFSFLEKDKK